MINDIANINVSQVTAVAQAFGNRIYTALLQSCKPRPILLFYSLQIAILLCITVCVISLPLSANITPQWLILLLKSCLLAVVCSRCMHAWGRSP